MNNNEKINELKAYEVIKRQWIDEVNSDCWILKHIKTGARIVLLSNNDDNKVFNIGFRTPVSDNTGVPHIVEHTVLCGSDRFPVKDPFMELEKGSLNTFLNAMTYPDKTIYPVASYNEQDFKNLMHVYMDAVFHPNIYNEEKIFKQEGWHYELESEDAELTYNGIVYNEMKGVYSSVDGVVDRVTLQSLFPDNGYCYESGGAPENITDLTYQEYLDFHKKYYHPSNSYIYLYGDMDMVERLEWMDEEYLSGYDCQKIESDVPLQKPFQELKKVTKSYSISENESTKDNAILSLNYVVGTSLDIELNIALQVLEYALMDMPGAPVKQALIDEGIGKDVYGQYEDSIYQPVYSFVAKYSNETDADRFISTIENKLKEIIHNGLDKNAIRAGLSSLEFKTKESDFGRYPKGLMYVLQMLSSWLYDDNEPFVLIETNKIFEKLKSAIETDYFEKIIEKYFINNNHKSLVTLIPEKGLTNLKEKELAEQLADKKAKMSPEEINDLIRETAELKKYQEEPSSEEELKCIPLLKLSDISPEPRSIIGQKSKNDNIEIVYNDLFTNGIGYVDILFDCSDIPKEYLPYMGLLKNILSYMDTEKYQYRDLNTDIDMNLGGLSVNTGIYVNDETRDTILTVEVHTKMLYEKIEKAYELIDEIILHTDFSDTKRLKEIIEEIKSRMNSALTKSGDRAATCRVMSYYSKPYYIREQLSGIDFYEFVKDMLDNFDTRKEELVEMLNKTVQKIFVKGRIILNYAGDRESFEKIKDLTFKLNTRLPEKLINQEMWEVIHEQKNEGFKTSGQVQYVVRAGNYNELDGQHKFNGSLEVLGKILKSEYLWNNIRVLGGAYGCNCLFSQYGDVVFSSYRDPNLEKTNETYLNAADYIRNFTADEREMRKFIIGTISSKDMPMGAADRSGRELGIYITGMSYETLRQERQELLSTTQEDIRKLAPLIEKAMKQNNICVIGSQSSIDSAQELFKEIKELV